LILNFKLDGSYYVDPHADGMDNKSVLHGVVARSLSTNGTEYFNVTAAMMTAEPTTTIRATATSFETVVGSVHLSVTPGVTSNLLAAISTDPIAPVYVSLSSVLIERF
jgi:hypothetical protein